jgi:hypothetical protein
MGRMNQPPSRPPTGGAGPAGGQDVGGLAPLPASSPIGKPGQTFTTYEIRWDAVMGSPTPTGTGGGQ